MPEKVLEELIVSLFPLYIVFSSVIASVNTCTLLLLKITHLALLTRPYPPVW